MTLPAFLPGIVVALVGAAMLIFRKPLSLLQYAALREMRITRQPPDKVLPPLRKVIVVGSILFAAVGIYLALNPLVDQYTTAL